MVKQKQKICNREKTKIEIFSEIKSNETLR